MTHSPHFPTFERLRVLDILRLILTGAALGVPCGILVGMGSVLVCPWLLFALDVD